MKSSSCEVSGIWDTVTGKHKSSSKLLSLSGDPVNGTTVSVQATGKNGGLIKGRCVVRGFWGEDKRCEAEIDLYGGTIQGQTIRFPAPSVDLECWVEGYLPGEQFGPSAEPEKVVFTAVSVCGNAGLPEPVRRTLAFPKPADDPDVLLFEVPRFARSFHAMILDPIGDSWVEAIQGTDSTGTRLCTFMPNPYYLGSFGLPLSSEKLFLPSGVTRLRVNKFLPGIPATNPITFIFDLGL